MKQRDAYDIIRDWQASYCVGSKMPKDFREQASISFSNVYLSNLPEACRLRHVTEPIYRVIVPGEGPLLYFDDLYYSFSADVSGAAHFATKDKNTRSDIFLIVAKPKEALDFNKICADLFWDTPTKFSNENEVVSKLSLDNIMTIWYLKHAEDIPNYMQKGTSIDPADVGFDIETLVDKYKLPIEL